MLVLTVSSRLAVLRGEVDPSPHAAPGVRHDAETALQDGRHHRDVGPVPQQTPVVQLVVLEEARPLWWEEKGGRSGGRVMGEGSPHPESS